MRYCDPVGLRYLRDLLDTVMECYVKTAERRLHTLEGMQRRLEVTCDSTRARPVEADHELRITGLDLRGVQSLPAGEHTIAVHFGERMNEGPPSPAPVRHLHLVRLDGDTSAEELAEWMEFDPVLPAPVEFIGGAEQMPAGNTAYVYTELEAGTYAWVLGVPPEQGEVETLTVE